MPQGVGPGPVLDVYASLCSLTRVDARQQQDTSPCSEQVTGPRGPVTRPTVLRTGGLVASVGLQRGLVASLGLGEAFWHLEVPKGPTASSPCSMSLFWTG